MLLDQADKNQNRGIALATFPQLKEFDLIDSITQLVAYPQNALKFARQKRRPMNL